MTDADRAAVTDADREEQLLGYVERFATLLRDSGMPIMPARLLAYLLASDQEKFTAAELAAGLRASPAAISGAVRYLVHVGLLVRERKASSNSALYRLYGGGAFDQLYRGQLSRLRAYVDVTDHGAAIVGHDSTGGRRLRETARFFAFIVEEYPAMLERWHTRQTEDNSTL